MLFKKQKEETIIPVPEPEPQQWLCSICGDIFSKDELPHTCKPLPPAPDKQDKILEMLEAMQQNNIQNEILAGIEALRREIQRELTQLRMELRSR